MDKECQCKLINWVEYNEKEHILDKCISCYCKYVREEFTYEEYENKCIFSKTFSKTNNAKFIKFKEICMIS
jgi:hypothetical protein